MSTLSSKHGNEPWHECMHACHARSIHPTCCLFLRFLFFSFSFPRRGSSCPATKPKNLDRTGQLQGLPVGWLASPRTMGMIKPIIHCHHSRWARGEEKVYRLTGTTRY
ncbi:hypothetical protein I7I53_02689 [Histoplasma capsulatum var. duboisii H88]|uniref:Uncharacterized protein n=1 Tax=Ajellomyces capsulatus (strain H88) TaxID=544711 RepID=A0A8A1LSI9_AJEC8|nr:hypothetical protein I7I53_02689 [Histoplasma capsulatum var. duboisii H88]